MITFHLFLFASVHVVAGASSASGLDAGVSLHGLRPAQRNLQEFPFRRYLVDFQGITSDESSCPAPSPTVTISCTAQLVLQDQLDTDCVPDGNTLTCTGSGRALVDCQATNALLDLTTALALTVEMNPPAEGSFSCSNIDIVGQGAFIGVICPDLTEIYDEIVCSPVTAYQVVNSTPLCLTACAGATCTDQNLDAIVAEVIAPGSCLWEPSTGTTSVPTATLQATPAPSTQVLTTVAPTLASVPVATVAPSPMFTTIPMPTITPQVPTSAPSTQVTVAPTVASVPVATSAPSATSSPVATTQSPTAVPTTAPTSVSIPSTEPTAELTAEPTSTSGTKAKGVLFAVMLFTSATAMVFGS